MHEIEYTNILPILSLIVKQKPPKRGGSQWFKKF